jgi:hypothetical protein
MLIALNLDLHFRYVVGDGQISFCRSNHLRNAHTRCGLEQRDLPAGKADDGKISAKVYFCKPIEG